MTGPRVGDRVRVVLEGKVSGAVENAWIASHGDPVVSVEVLRPPVKVGDVIDTAEQLDALSEGTIVLGPDGDAWRVTELLISNARLWRSTSGHQPLVGHPATVLYLPDGAA